MHSKFAVAAGIVAIGVIAVVLPAGAHHAHGNYAVEMTDMEGVVTEVHALNPHSWVYISRSDAAGKEQLWALEGGTCRRASPAGVRRQGPQGRRQGQGAMPSVEGRQSRLSVGVHEASRRNHVRP